MFNKSAVGHDESRRFKYDSTIQKIEATKNICTNISARITSPSIGTTQNLIVNVDLALIHVRASASMNLSTELVPGASSALVHEKPAIDRA